MTGTGLATGTGTELCARLPDGTGIEIRVQDGVITHIECDPGAEGPSAPIVLPGLVDLQVNGYAGLDVNDPHPGIDAITSLCRALSPQGITAFCPTVISAGEDEICDRVRAIHDARAADPLSAAMIAGIHLEGPFLAAADGPRGAHDGKFLRPPDLVAFRRWQRAAGGLIRIVTVAPELPGAMDFIRSVVADGVAVSIGHTAAPPEVIRAAAAAGARLSTHLGNGAHAMLPRHPNYLWAQLAEDRLIATFIADGQHLPADTFTAMMRAKGPARTILISDSVALAGQPPGDYHTPVGQRVHLGTDGRIALAGSGLLAGSGSSLADCLRWVVRVVGTPLAEVAAMTSVNAARLLDLTGGRRIEVGAPATLTLLGGTEPTNPPAPDSPTIVGTIVNGVWTYRA